MAWLALGLLTALLYGLAALGRGQALPLLRVAQFQFVPALAAVMWCLRRSAFLRCALLQAAAAHWSGRAALSQLHVPLMCCRCWGGTAISPYRCWPARLHLLCHPLPHPATHTFCPPTCRHREALWFAQRCVVLLATSLPGSFVFTQPAAVPLFAFGLCNLTFEVLTRRVSLPAAPAWLPASLPACLVASTVCLLHLRRARRTALLPRRAACPAPHPPTHPPTHPTLSSPCLQLRLHLQLLSSLFTYAATLSLMSLHPECSLGRSLVTRESSVSHTHTRKPSVIPATPLAQAAACRWPAGWRPGTAGLATSAIGCRDHAPDAHPLTHRIHCSRLTPPTLPPCTRPAVQPPTSLCTWR